MIRRFRAFALAMLLLAATPLKTLAEQDVLDETDEVISESATTEDRQISGPEEEEEPLVESEAELGSIPEAPEGQEDPKEGKRAQPASAEAIMETEARSSSMAEGSKRQVLKTTALGDALLGRSGAKQILPHYMVMFL